jgi:phage baseplate assembly protein gpV
MASRFNTGLVAEATMDKPKFWFGIPEGKEAGEFQEVFYSVKKRIAAYRDSAANYIPGIVESDFVYYELQTEQPMNIGDIVRLNGKQLYVFETRVTIEESVLKNLCVLAPKNGLKQNLKLHPRVTGVTVNGTVIDLQKDQLKVHLEIDQEQDKSKAYWFPYTTSYTTEGNTGWYCMPELGDTVSLYFPNAKEEEGVVCNSIRQGSQGGNKIDDPGVKYFRTKFGKELMFNDKQIVITGKDGEILINLEEEKGIEIYSEKDIKIQCKNDMFIDVGHKMTVTAGDEIGIKCKASNIVMDGVTYIKGTNVKEN